MNNRGNLPLFVAMAVGIVSGVYIWQPYLAPQTANRPPPPTTTVSNVPASDDSSAPLPSTQEEQ
ncbi:hypothetical protein IWQ62_004953, partial [Dispira parvispora]